MREATQPHAFRQESTHTCGNLSSWPPSSTRCGLERTAANFAERHLVCARVDLGASGGSTPAAPTWRRARAATGAEPRCRKGSSAGFKEQRLKRLPRWRSWLSTLMRSRRAICAQTRVHGVRMRWAHPMRARQMRCVPSGLRVGKVMRLAHSTRWAYAAGGVQQVGESDGIGAAHEADATDVGTSGPVEAIRKVSAQAMRSGCTPSGQCRPSNRRKPWSVQVVVSATCAL